MGFEIEDIVNIALCIKQQFTEQMSKLPQYSKEKMEELFLQDKRNYNNKDALEKYLNFCALCKYEDFLSKPTVIEEGKDYIESISCHDLCQAVISLFQLNIEELEDKARFQEFLNRFSVELGNNTSMSYTRHTESL